MGANIRALEFRIALLLGLAAILLPATAQAANPAVSKQCENSYPASKQIAACSKIIDNPQESKADRVKALLKRAWLLQYDHKNVAAYADADEAIKLEPSADNYDARARMFVDDKNFGRAIADYSVAIKLEASGYRFFSRGELYRKKGEQALAIADYKAAAADYSATLAQHPEYAYVYRSRSDAYRNLGEIDKALADFNEFLKRKKDSDDVLMADRGDLYLRKADFEHAIADYTTAINKEPTYVDRYQRRALAYRLKGDYKSAILDYDRIVKENDQGAETYIGRGLAYVGLGEPERAAVDFTKAIDIFSEDATPFYDRAQAEREGGHFDVAITDYTAAIERNPKYAIAFNSRGRAYLALKNTTHALADFNEAIRLNSKFGAAFLNRGFLHQGNGRMHEAIADFGRAIAADPTNADFLVARAQAFAASGAHDDAEKVYTAALKVDPIDSLAYVGRAATRLKLGAMAKGLDDANRAVLLNKELAAAYAVRADIHAALNQPDKAGADRATAESLAKRQADARSALEHARKHPRVKIVVSGSFPIIPPYLKRTFKFDNVVDVKDDEITYHSPGLAPYKVLSGDKVEETFSGLCNGKKTSNEGVRVVSATVDKTLVIVQLQSHLDFVTGACRGQHNYYKEEFLIDFSHGGCKFSYTQERDLLGNSQFGNKIADQACVVESLR